MTLLNAWFHAPLNRSLSLSLVHTSKRCVPRKKKTKKKKGEEKRKKKKKKKKKERKKKCVYDQTHIRKNWERCAAEFSRLT